jgi:hypothetical protein
MRENMSDMEAERKELPPAGPVPAASPDRDQRKPDDFRIAIYGTNDWKDIESKDVEKSRIASLKMKLQD